MRINGHDFEIYTKYEYYQKCIKCGMIAFEEHGIWRISSISILSNPLKLVRDISCNDYEIYEIIK